LCCLFFCLLAIVLSVLLSFGHCIKRQKNRQYNGQKTEEQTIQWPKDRRTDNTMAKRQKNRQYNGQKTEGQTIQWPKDPLYCLSFDLQILIIMLYIKINLSKNCNSKLVKH
jgi:hypothetical protein